MSKTVVLGAVAATGVVAATVPTAILYGGSGQSGTTKEYIPQLTDASNIKNEDKYKEVGCLSSYFGTITFSKIQDSKLKSSDINDFANNSRSCLLVEYNKKTYTDQKWHGEFRFIWVVKDDNQGLITVTSARTVEGGFKGSSAAYILKKDSGKTSWTTSHKYEVSERWKKNDSLKNLIPQATTSLPENPDTSNYWGFDPNIDNACKKGECTEKETNTIHNSYSWELIGNDTGDAVGSWASNINNWLKVIFDWDVLVNKINKVKGKWQKRVNW